MNQQQPNKRQVGTAGEQQAAEYLKNKGYEIVRMNARTRYGEIDIVAKQGETYVFVEVKLRSSNRYGKGFEAVIGTKQRRIKNCATMYCVMHNIHSLCRCDIISIDEGVITHIENAF
ncbi:YraN family protein [Deferribacterales bacterium RsTz2092]|nr:UPF0102 protein [Deferribacterales bacterium]